MRLVKNPHGNSGKSRAPYISGLLSSYNMCREWQCSANELMNYRNAGMPCQQINGYYYYNLAECQAWYRGE